MNRSLIAFQALIASSAVLCQTAEASATYSSPDQLNNSIEARIDSVRNGDWSSLLKTIDNDGELVAKSKWGNGGGHKFSNSYGSGKWKTAKAVISGATAVTPGGMAATTVVGATAAVPGATAAADSSTGDQFVEIWARPQPVRAHRSGGGAIHLAVQSRLLLLLSA